MSIGVDLLTQLKTVALVSDRVYALKAPQGITRPYISFQQISGIRDYTHNGFSGLKIARYQINCVGDSLASAKAVRDQVIAVMESWAVVSSAYYENEVEFHESDTNLFRVSLDFIIRYK